MKRALVPVMCLFFFAATLSGQKSAKPPATPVPSSKGLSASTVSAPPPGAKPAEIQDLRFLPPESEDPYEYERLGLSAMQAKDLVKARQFFEKAWKAGELPTAAYNLACVDAREGKTDAAFKGLDRAIAVGFDDEKTLENDSDLASLKGKPHFQAILARARKNRTQGDGAVLSEGIFVAPRRPAAGILLVLHDASSDPLSASSPFVDQAQARGLYLAAPRGPAKAGHKRFGWGSTERAFAAVDSALAEAQKKAAAQRVPVLMIGLGRGGTLAYTVAAKRHGSFIGVASLGGPYDPGTDSASSAAQGLRGLHLFMGIPRDAPSSLAGAFRRGIDTLRKLGLAPATTEWPGTGTSLPPNAGSAVRGTLDSLGAPAAAEEPPAAKASVP